MHKRRKEGWLQNCPLLYDQARCMHPPFVKCSVKETPRREEGTKVNPAGPIVRSRKSSNAFCLPATPPVVCGTTCWSICGTPVRIRRSPEPSPGIGVRPYRRPWTDLNWSEQLQRRLLIPLWFCEPDSSCPVRSSLPCSSALVHSDRK